MPHWTDDQLKFYSSRSYTVKKEDSRRDIFTYLKKTFAEHPLFKSKYSRLFDGGFPEFNHWHSIIQTRSHGIKPELWAQCSDYQISDENPSHQTNKLLHHENVFVIVPLVALSNHRQPKKIDMSDIVSFNFKIKEKNGVKILGFPA